MVRSIGRPYSEDSGQRRIKTSVTTIDSSGGVSGWRGGKAGQRPALPPHSLTPFTVVTIDWRRSNHPGKAVSPTVFTVRTAGRPGLPARTGGGGMGQAERFIENMFAIWQVE